MADEVPLALRRPRRDRTPKPPSMHCLYKPVKKDWGCTDWAEYVEGDREHWRKGFREWTEQQRDTYFEQKTVSISLHVMKPCRFAFQQASQNNRFATNICWDSRFHEGSQTRT